MDGGMTPNLKLEVPPKKIHEVVQPIQASPGFTRTFAQEHHKDSRSDKMASRGYFSTRVLL